MIKLFWNTHNQKKSTTKDQQFIKRELENYKWGIYHKKNSNIWIFEILKKINFNIIDSEENLNKKDILIVIDSSPETKKEFYDKINLTCSKVFLFHLGDETGAYDLSQIYSKFDFVFRPFCSNKYFNNKKVKCIPIGYKSGVINKKKQQRKYKWTFTGTPHKSSRHDLLFQLSSIKPFFCHKTEKFDTKIISVEEMSEILSSTQFLPCPNGFFHPETYRLYEALECGCIPIVENAYQYYDRLFPKNPFIKVDKWKDAKSIIINWNIEEIHKKQKECESWWNAYKTNLQEFIKNKVSN
tara:strand:+ start:1642 stop:2532 length:891 start_codon:yes stop_codon:yes gene_type:complete